MSNPTTPPPADAGRLSDEDLAAIRERRRRASDSSHWPTTLDNFSYCVRTANGAETVWEVQFGQYDLEFCRAAAADVTALLAEVARLRDKLASIDG